MYVAYTRKYLIQTEHLQHMKLEYLLKSANTWAAHVLLYFPVEEGVEV